jgi:Protein of unknown function (DUF2934)
MKHQQTAPARTVRAKSPPHGAVAAGTMTDALDPHAGREALIRTTAYSYYEARGCVDGHDLEDWLKAEAEFEQSHAPLAAQTPPGSTSH